MDHVRIISMYIKDQDRYLSSIFVTVGSSSLVWVVSLEPKMYDKRSLFSLFL